MIAVVKQKHRAVNPLAGSLVHLVEQDSGRLVIGDLQRGRLTVLDLNTVGRGIQQVAGRSLQFRHGVPAAFSFGEIDDTIAVRCEGADDLTVHLADLEFDPGDTLSTVFVALDDLQPARRRVVIAIGNPPLLSQLDWDCQGGFSPASHRACDFHRTRRSINANYLLRVCEITSLSL